MIQCAQRRSTSWEVFTCSRLAQRFEVKRFVFGSSLSVYGTCSADRFVSEADRAAPEDLYGAAKLYVEQLGEAYRQSHGLEFTSLRIGRVVGTGAESATSAWRSEIFEKLASTDASEILLPYVGSERILLVHVDDVAKMLVALLQAACPAHGVYNAVCESVIVSDLKHEVERLNSNVRVQLRGEVRWGQSSAAELEPISGGIRLSDTYPYSSS